MPITIFFSVMCSSNYRGSTFLRRSDNTVWRYPMSLWSFCCGACCSITVNLGDDADTVGAIYGQLAGAYYGVDSIPEEWRKKCALYPLIKVFASELLTLSESIPAQDLPDSTDWNSLYPPLPETKCERSRSWWPALQTRLHASITKAVFIKFLKLQCLSSICRGDSLLKTYFIFWSE